MHLYLKNLTTIGRVEKMDFPILELLGIDAKIDTGAFSSAIHCHEIQENKEEGVIEFKLLDPNHPEYNTKVFKTKEYSKTNIRSAFGDSEQRFKINATIKLGDKKYKTNFTLTDRSKMKYPVLLGRKALTNKFIVDVSQKYILI